MNRHVTNDKSQVQVIARAATILRALEDENGGLSLGQIAQRVNLARSTVQRIVSALETEKLVIAATPNGRVRLAATAVDSKVVISVEDNGPGVPPEVLPKIFDPYFSTKSTGTGLGLAIARQLATALGASLSLRNRPEGGLEARLALPKEAEARGPVEHAAHGGVSEGQRPAL